MATAKPTVVLIPGAWHSASCYDILLPHLHASGYPTLPLTLPSVGANPAQQSLGPDVQHIRTNIIPLLDRGNDVVLAMHSYGGVPGASAMRGLSKRKREAEGLPGGVVALVFICAWMIEEGTTARDYGGGRGGKLGLSSLSVEDGRSTHLKPIEAMYHDVPVEVAEELVKGLRTHSVPTLGAPCQYSAFKHIPTTYLLARNDRMIAYEKQLEVVERAGVSIATYTCDASHSPFVSQPEFTARTIRKAAGEDIEV